VTGDVTYGVIEMTLGARIDGRLIPLRSVASTGVGAVSAVEADRGDNVLRPFELRQGRN
jgi:cytoskeletal protein CcmA (bactofilin family)